MRFIVFYLFLAGWVGMWWWTYVFHIKACGPWPGWMTEEAIYISGDTYLPISFRWGSAVPVVSDRYEQWRDSLMTTLGSRDILQVYGIAYRDEPFEDGTLALAHERAQGIGRLLSEFLPSERIRELAVIGTLEADLKNRLFKGYRMQVLTRNAYILERPDYTLLHFPFDSVHMEGIDAVYDYLDLFGRESGNSGIPVLVQSCVSFDSTDVSARALHQWRLDRISGRLLESGLDSAHVLPAQAADLNSLDLDPNTPGWDVHACYLITRRK